MKVRLSKSIFHVLTLLSLLAALFNFQSVTPALAAPALYIKANPTNDTIHVYEGPSGTNVTISIDNPSNGVGKDYTATVAVGQASWDPGNPDDLVAEFNLSGVFDLQAGDKITATGIGGTYTVTDLKQVRWFIGIETGTDAGQIFVEHDVVGDFNSTNADIELMMEVQPYPSARNTLFAEIAANNAPDVVGPVGWQGANTFHGYWLDLETLSSWSGYDTSPFNPALLNSYVTDEGRVGLPFVVYPSAMFYNPALFDEAGLHYPPAHYGDQYEMPDTSMVDWNWDTVAAVSKLLTVDSNGKNATEAGFNQNNIVEYGFSFGFENKPNYWGSFWQSGSLLQPGGSPGSYVAAVPAAWNAAWKWVYNGMWGNQLYIPTDAAATTPELGNGNVFDSGKVAMLENPSWYTCCMGNLIANNGTFQLGAMPAYNGQVAGRVDDDTFRILQASHHPEEAFTVLKYLVGPAVDKLIIGSVGQPPAYGGVPALTAKEQDFADSLAARFPFLTTNSENILLDGLDYPDVPSADGWIPNYNRAWFYLQSFGDNIGNTPGINMDNAIASLEADLTSTFNTDPPTVLSVVRSSSSPTAAAHVNFKVTFSKPVTGVDAADFSLTKPGITGASVTSVSGSGATRTVSVNTGSGNGTIRLNVIDNLTILDTLSNPLSGPFTAGQVYSINKTVILNSIGAQDGRVLESSETSGQGGTFNSAAATFLLGDDAAKRQYRGILSFNTASLPDTAVITGVSLKVKTQGIVGGGNPLATFQGFQVDIKKGIFSSTALQAADFQSLASHTYGPFSPALIGNFYSINLTSGRVDINKLSTNSGLTQIRLRFKLDDNNNAVANYLSLYSGNAAVADRPQLVITYYVP